jgi:hypothetical protein
MISIKNIKEENEINLIKLNKDKNDQYNYKKNKNLVILIQFIHYFWKLK